MTGCAHEWALPREPNRVRCLHCGITAERRRAGSPWISGEVGPEAVIPLERTRPAQVSWLWAEDWDSPEDAVYDTW